MARTEKFTVPEVVEAIKKGVTPTGAAKLLDCDPDTVRNYAKRHPTVKAALKSKRKELVDLAEMGLRGALLTAQPWAVTFTLKTLGKEDGYVERQEVSGADGGPIQHEEVNGITPERKEELLKAIIDRIQKRTGEPG